MYKVTFGDAKFQHFDNKTICNISAKLVDTEHGTVYVTRVFTGESKLHPEEFSDEEMGNAVAKSRALCKAYKYMYDRTFDCLLWSDIATLIIRGKMLKYYYNEKNHLCYLKDNPAIYPDIDLEDYVSDEICRIMPVL